MQPCPSKAQRGKGLDGKGGRSGGEVGGGSTLEIGVVALGTRVNAGLELYAHRHGAQPAEASGSQVGPFIRYAKVSQVTVRLSGVRPIASPRVWVWEMPGGRGHTGR